MGLFDNVFGGKKVECPRCLGKGHVDQADIKRLNMELRWLPGSCAFCEGTGQVSPKMAVDVPVNEAYLSADLSKEERKRFLSNEEGAMRRARQSDEIVNRLINEVRYLHFKGGMSPEKILGFYFLDSENSETHPEEKKDFLTYIHNILK